MRYKKEPTIPTRIKEDVMNNVMRRIKNTGENRSDFISNAVEKEITRLDDELNGKYFKIMRDQYFDNEESYYVKGIKSFEEFVFRMATSTDEITNLKNDQQILYDALSEVFPKFKNVKQIKSLIQEKKNRYLKMIKEYEKKTAKYKKELELLRSRKHS